MSLLTEWMEREDWLTAGTILPDSASTWGIFKQKAAEVIDMGLAWYVFRAASQEEGWDIPSSLPVFPAVPRPRFHSLVLVTSSVFPALRPSHPRYLLTFRSHSAPFPRPSLSLPPPPPPPSRAYSSSIPRNHPILPLMSLCPVPPFTSLPSSRCRFFLPS